MLKISPQKETRAQDLILMSELEYLNESEDGKAVPGYATARSNHLSADHGDQVWTQQQDKSLSLLSRIGIIAVFPFPSQNQELLLITSLDIVWELTAQCILSTCFIVSIK